MDEPWDEAGDEDAPGDATLQGARPFGVIEALNAGLLMMRQEPGAFYGLAALGLTPALVWLLGLEYFGVTRRLLETSTRYDDAIWISALVLPLLLGWKGVCGLAQVFGALEVLRRRSLPEAERRALGPLAIAPLLRRALGRLVPALLSELARWVVLWLPVLLVSTWVLSVDPEMESWVRWLFGVVVFCFGAPLVVLVSGATLRWMPAATGLDQGRGALGGAALRGIGASFALGIVTILLGLNLVLGVNLALYLLDALFAVDVSYWERFFALSHRLYLLGVGVLALAIMEPLFRAVPALVWVDALVRRDALDLTSEVARVEAAAGRRVAGAALPENPSARGDREALTKASAVWVGLGAALAATLALSVGGGAAAAQPAGEPPGLSAEALREARMTLPGSDGDDWVDVEPLRELAEARRSQATSSKERLYWEDLRAQVEAVSSASGEQRSWEMALLRARLNGPTLLDPDAEAAEDALASPGEVRGAVKEILAGDAYRDLAGDAIKRDAPSLDLRERPDSRRKRSDCDSEQPTEPSGLKAPAFEAPVSTFKAIALALLVLALGLLGFVLVRRFMERRDEDAARAVEGALPLTSDIAAQAPGAEDVLAFSFGAWQARAEELAAAGEHRLAVRCLYLAVLVTLHRRGLIGYESQGTNMEYGRDLRRSIASRPDGLGGEVVLSGFDEVVEAFEYAWYGRYAVDAPAYARCRAALDRMAAAPLLRQDSPEANP